MQNIFLSSKIYNMLTKDGFNLHTKNYSFLLYLYRHSFQIKQQARLHIHLSVYLKQYAHIENYIQPGLDSAAKNPVRMVISYLYTENPSNTFESFILLSSYKKL
mgnify:CR=1 FL=1